MRLFRRVSVLIVLLGGAVGGPAAQGLPEWAAPYEPPNPYGSGLPEAETEDFGGWGTPLPDAPGKPVPIDGGLGLLAAAGAGYALKKLRRRA